jgi:uncharacterized protein YxeA
MKKILVLIIVCIMLFALAGCALHEYEYADSAEKGRTIDINGVLYRTLPETP